MLRISQEPPSRRTRLSPSEENQGRPAGRRGRRSSRRPRPEGRASGWAGGAREKFLPGAEVTTGRMGLVIYFLMEKSFVEHTPRLTPGPSPRGPERGRKGSPRERQGSGGPVRPRHCRSWAASGGLWRRGHLCGRCRGCVRLSLMGGRGGHAWGSTGAREGPGSVGAGGATRGGWSAGCPGTRGSRASRALAAGRLRGPSAHAPMARRTPPPGWEALSGADFVPGPRGLLRQSCRCEHAPPASSAGPLRPRGPHCAGSHGGAVLSVRPRGLSAVWVPGLAVAPAPQGAWAAPDSPRLGGGVGGTPCLGCEALS